MHWKRNLISLCLAQFLSMMGVSFFLPFIPLYLKELGLTDPAEVANWSGIIFSVGFLFLSLSAPFWGHLADRFGRKIMVVRALGAGSVVLLLTSFVETPGQLVLLRILHGLTSGFVSAAIALVAANAPKKSLGMSLGMFQSSVTAGLICGPFLGGVLQDHYGIRDAIFIGGVILLLGTLVAVLLIQERHVDAAPDKRGGPWQNAKFVFDDVTLWPAAWLQVLTNMCFIAVQPVLAIFVVSLFQGTSSHLGRVTGMVISAAAVGMMIGAPFWGGLTDRLGRKKILSISLVSAGVAFFIQALAQNIPVLLLGRLFQGFFGAGATLSLHTLIALHAPAERRSGILGVAFSLTMIGNASGPLWAGALAAAFGIRVPFFLAGVLLLVASYLSLRSKLAFKEKISYSATETA